MEHDLLIQRQIQSRAQQKTLQLPARIILWVNLLERVSFYSLLANLIVTLKGDPFNWSSTNAATITLMFSGITYIFTLVGGYLADSVLGKFKTMTMAFIIYLLFYAGFPLLLMNNISFVEFNTGPLPCFCHYFNMSKPNSTQSSTYFFQESCSGLVLIIVVAISCGSGMVKAVLGPFGADQIRNQNREMSRYFFNTLYWMTNAGTFVAYLGVAYIQQNLSLFYGYLVPLIFLFAATVLFISGYPVYHHRPITSSILQDIFSVIKEAFQRRCLCSQASCQCCCRREVVDCAHSQSEDGSIQWLNSSGSSEYERQYGGNDGSSLAFFDVCKFRYGGSHHETLVEDVRTVVQHTSSLLLLIPFWLIYFQMESAFLVQGMHMRMTWNNQSTNCSNDRSLITVPVAWLQLFDVVILLLILPILNNFIYPIFDKHLHRLTNVFIRMLTGMFFSMGSVLVAAELETYRVKMIEQDDWICQTIGNNTHKAANMWIWWQTFQYTLIGIGEAFTLVAGLEFVYSHSPKMMQTLMTGVFFFISGLSSILGAVVLSAFEEMLNLRHPNEGKYNVYFFVLSGIQALGIVLFSLLIIRYCRNLNRGNETDAAPKLTAENSDALS